MNIKYITMLLMVVCATASTGCVGNANTSTPDNKSTSTTKQIGINLDLMDKSVRPQDDFYMYANGNWDRKTQIPSNQSIWTTMDQLSQQSIDNQYTIIKQLLQSHPTTGNSYKLTQIYLDYMDQNQLNQLGITPISDLLAQITNIKSSSDLASTIGNFVALNITTPLALIIGKDAKNTTMIASLEENGLGLPDRDYYLTKDDATMADIRQAYKAHIGKVFSLAGLDISEAQINDVYQLEESIAAIQISQEELRNPEQQYNHYSLQELKSNFSGFAWDDYLKSSGLADKITMINVNEPRYLQNLMPLFNNVSLSTWQNYLRFHAIEKFAPYLTQDMSDEYFAFNKKTLLGTQEQLPRWQNAIDLLNNVMGDALGELYVKEYFNAQNKAKITDLINNILETYRTSINKSDWMSSDTKTKALAKLDNLNVKVGYPTKWQDYSQIIIKPQHLVENIITINQFLHQEQLNKLGKDIDRQEWEMTPQTVNAYYEPLLNEIVFPAAILQPPYFSATADDAANYGGIGMIIGHEISHGFDDQGSLYDEEGNLKPWMADADHKKFAAKTSALVSQYAQYTVLNKYHVNGNLTLGENIADNSGMRIAYLAYESTLHGKSSPVINGLTGEQRFYISFSQGWQTKTRDNYAISALKTDPHTPGKIRAYAPLLNQDGFYKAFNIPANSNMYLPPEKRVIIW